MEELYELRKRLKAQDDARKTELIAFDSQNEEDFRLETEELIRKRRRIDKELEEIRVRKEVKYVNKRDAMLDDYPDCDLTDTVEIICHLTSQQGVVLPKDFVEMVRNQETDSEEWQAVNRFLSSRVDIVNAKADFWFRGRVEGYKGSETRFEYDGHHPPDCQSAEFWAEADWTEYEVYDSKQASIVWPDSTDAGWAQAVITRSVVVLTLKK